MTAPVRLGLRDDMRESAIQFQKLLNQDHGGQLSNFIFLVDLNTIGMNLRFSKKDVRAAEEIEHVKKQLAGSLVKMELLDKTAVNTCRPWENASFNPGDLDHVIASQQLDFKKFVCALRRPRVAGRRL